MKINMFKNQKETFSKLPCNNLYLGIKSPMNPNFLRKGLKRKKLVKSSSDLLLLGKKLKQVGVA